MIDEPYYELQVTHIKSEKVTNKNIKLFLLLIKPQISLTKHKKVRHLKSSNKQKKIKPFTHQRQNQQAYIHINSPTTTIQFQKKPNPKSHDTTVKILQETITHTTVKNTNNC